MVTIRKRSRPKKLASLMATVKSERDLDDLLAAGRSIAAKKLRRGETLEAGIIALGLGAVDVLRTALEQDVKKHGDHHTKG